MNLREHLFASSHEADIYTRRFFFSLLKCYTILERQTNRSIFLFAVHRTQRVHVHKNAQLHFILSFFPFFLVLVARMHGNDDQRHQFKTHANNKPNTAHAESKAIEELDENKSQNQQKCIPRTEWNDMGTNVNAECARESE